MHFRFRLISLFLLLTLANIAWSSDGDPPLPVPLTLKQLMELPLQGVSVLRAEARLQQREATLDSIYGLDDASWYLILEPRVIEPSPLATNTSRNDARAALQFSKSLYDFGRQVNAEAAGEYELSATKVLSAVAQNTYRLNLMRAYFDVVVADLAFLRDNEAMATSYVRLERLIAKKALEQVSELEIAEQRQHYHQQRIRYYDSRSRQQTARGQLAMLMNRPGQLVSEIADPALLPSWPVPPLEQTRKQVLSNNPVLLAERTRLQALESRVQQARSDYWPVISAEGAYFEFERELPNQDQWRFGIKMEIPLWQGGRVPSAVALASARYREQQLRVRDIELSLSQQVHELLEKIRYLNVARDQAKQLLEYRDLNLDLSRTRYEFELQSDLGDSMVHVSAAKFEVMQVETRRIMAWAQLQTLMGKPAYPIEPPAKDKPTEQSEQE